MACYCFIGTALYRVGFALGFVKARPEWLAHPALQLAMTTRHDNPAIFLRFPSRTMSPIFFAAILWNISLYIAS